MGPPGKFAAKSSAFCAGRPFATLPRLVPTLCTQSVRSLRLHLKGLLLLPLHPCGKADSIFQTSPDFYSQTGDAKPMAKNTRYRHNCTHFTTLQKGSLETSWIAPPGRFQVIKQISCNLIDKVAQVGLTLLLACRLLSIEGSWCFQQGMEKFYKDIHGLESCCSCQ